LILEIQNFKIAFFGAIYSHPKKQKGAPTTQGKRNGEEKEKEKARLLTEPRA
jgi:hypothetical protein